MIKKFFHPYFEPDHCLVNLSSSIAASFGLQIFHPTLSLVDSFLRKRRNNVVILLLDGLGRNILEKHLQKNCFLRNHLVECFIRPPSLEAMATNFFIREAKREEFIRLFREIYGGKDFFLLEMREVLSQKLFGLGVSHPLVEFVLGDFLAIALGDKALFLNGTNFVGHHSGWTSEEFEIPLILWRCES